ncbi:hypothetical protein [Mesorhizobium sp. WSM4904]|uniref:hypothetical protein n=1 Tax=Mesorhizobium sp. WSM4904 TaxID=3038545 RepID=UPI00241822F5|nr:hypothetical protein [Mesorhizobium sp. WSM4904]WFP61370.1 hypothetical protein QAZ47_23180 [Mesorhizobium sp. WSM4904]
MTKLGRPYEQVVGDVAKQFDPAAQVTVGEWVEGPDGRREVDVLITGTVDDVPRRVLIECKDYDSRKRRIGIGIIDAADSKRRDLGIDLTLICSNAGFSTDAMRKARRVGIGLIGILKEADPRIRYKVFDEIYARRINLSMKADIDIKVVSGSVAAWAVEAITFESASVFAWLQHRVILFVTHNRVVKGTHYLRFRFRPPVLIQQGTHSAFMTEISLRFTLTGQWIAQQVEIDATSGLYDWLRKRVQLAPVPGDSRLVYKDVKFGTGGTVIDSHPDIDSLSPSPVKENEVHMEIIDLGGFVVPTEYAQLDSHVVPEDADPVRPDIIPEAFRSSPRL